MFRRSAIRKAAEQMKNVQRERAATARAATSASKKPGMASKMLTAARGLPDKLSKLALEKAKERATRPGKPMPSFGKAAKSFVNRMKTKAVARPNPEADTGTDMGGGPGGSYENTGGSSPVAFKKGGMAMKGKMADKAGRAMKKPTADAKGRAMAKAKGYAAGGMAKGYAAGGMAKGYAGGGKVAAGKATRGYGAARKGC